MSWRCRLVSILMMMVVGHPATGRAQVQLPSQDRILLAEAIRVADQEADRVWPGWGRAAMPILLVTDTTEFLLGHAEPSTDFVRLGYDSLLHKDVWIRPRQFPPAILATFPAVGGVPTIVVGSAARTRKPPAPWVLTVLHEHFHQWQYSQPWYYPGVAGLDLAAGDTTGRWMLDYPFPYDSAPVQRAVRRLSLAIARALNVPPGRRPSALKEVLRRRDALRGSLTAADYRYLEFQLWQEGAARFIEYAVAAAGGKPGDAMQALPGFESYPNVAAQARRGLQRELERLSLSRDRRVSFYPLGAGVCLLLDATRPDWKRSYQDHPFALLNLLGPAP